jgi:hypothetical protein
MTGEVKLSKRPPESCWPPAVFASNVQSFINDVSAIPALSAVIKEQSQIEMAKQKSARKRIDEVRHFQGRHAAKNLIQGTFT